MTVLVTLRARRPIVFITEDPPPAFIVYHIAHVPVDANMIRSFHSRVGQPLYRSTCDFNDDGMIDMRDISIAIKNSVVSAGASP